MGDSVINLLAADTPDHAITVQDSPVNVQGSPVVENNDLHCDLAPSQAWVWDAAFSADSRHVVTASSDQTARIWSVASGECVQELKGHQRAVTCVALHDT